MTEQTDIDRAIAALSAAPEDEALNLALHARIAEAELFVVLEEEPQGETVRPTILETSTGKLALAFDREERMVAFMGDATAYVALAGRSVAQMFSGGEVGMALNLGTDHETALGPEAMAWIAEAVQDTTREVVARITEITRPGTLPEALLTALDRRLGALSGVADTALLGGAVYDTGVRGHVLAVVGAPEGAQPGIAASIGEALRLSGLEAASLDVLFLPADHQITQALGRNGLRFDIPEPEVAEWSAPKAPGSDPDAPPRLR